MSDAIRHLSDDQIQDWLDGRLPRNEVGRLEAHLDGCARCRAEAEGWRALVHELSALPPLAPTLGFSGRVLDAVGRAQSPLLLAARIRAALRSWVGGPALDGHPGADRLQDFVDGALAGRKASAVRAHLTACAPCREQAQSWSAIVRELGTLPGLAPSPVFAQGVMARVRIPQPAPKRVALAHRVLDRVRAFSGPRHRRAWAAAAGIAFTPGITVAVVAYAVFSHPLMTVGNLVTFLGLKGSAMTTALGGGLVTGVVQNAALFRAWTAIGSLARSPATAGAGLLVFSVLTLASAWILYRNLFNAQAAPAYAKSA